jgi:ParB-like chromosome segregation protein Spo0J
MPAMSDSEYQDLLADIKAYGLLITLYKDKVLDGRNRLRACQEAGIEPSFNEYSGSNPAEFVPNSSAS